MLPRSLRLVIFRIRFGSSRRLVIQVSHVQLIMPHKRKADKVDKREEKFKQKRVAKTVEVLLGYRDGGVVPDDQTEFWERDIVDALAFLESANAANSNAASSSTDPVLQSTTEPTIEA